MTAQTNELNPIWVRFCSERMPEWLEWLRNIDINSHLELAERFIVLHPHYLPNSRTDDTTYATTFNHLMVDEQFMSQVSDKGLLVWANSNFLDFLDALDVYTGAYPEINIISRYFERHIGWFNRLYAYLRAKLILLLREEGRNI
jgi:hypothetical protein